MTDRVRILRLDYRLAYVNYGLGAGDNDGQAVMRAADATLGLGFDRDRLDKLLNFFPGLVETLFLPPAEAHLHFYFITLL